MVKATNIYYFTVSVGQDSGCGLTESSGPGSWVLGHFKAQGENLLPISLGRLLAGFSSLQAVGLRVSVPNWLVAEAALLHKHGSWPAMRVNKQEAKGGEQGRSQNLLVT